MLHALSASFKQTVTNTIARYAADFFDPAELICLSTALLGHMLLLRDPLRAKYARVMTAFRRLTLAILGF